MTLDWLAEPISEDAPTGPDLEATDDGAFLDYYFEAESQMPERYFTPGIKGDGDEFMPGTLFDKKSINLKADKATITDLLKRSRDLRLLSLLARLSILAGDLKSFSEALDGIALVMETFPEDMHPKDASDRRGALDDLGNSVVVSIPLQYAELAGPGEVSLRRLHVATGKSQPRAGELDLDASKLAQELGSPGNAKAVDAAHASLSQAAAALARIKSAALMADNPFNPAVDPTVDTVREMQELIAASRPDLPVWSADAASAADQTDADPTEDAAVDGDGEGPAPAAVPVAAPTIVTKIPSRTAAKRTLTAVEAYFATHEPASPAMLLITQARLLIGMPLVDAIDTLMPEEAARTSIDFGPSTGFKLEMASLRALAREGAANAATLDEDPGEDPVVANRADVAGHINALEEFFRAREPASPIPMLLFKARTYLEKDFAAIVAELIPPKVEQHTE